MLGGKKHQFYVQFLGWVETAGLQGTRYTDPVISDLRAKAKKWKYAPKLTLQVSKKELKITQDIQDEKKKGKKIKTIKFPIIPSRDITYAVQALSPMDGTPDDIVACIYLGYVPRTQRYVHVHVYRFDSSETATTFVRCLNQIIAMNADRTNEIEQQLIEQGHIENPRSVPYTAVNNNNNNIHHRFNSSDGMSDRPAYEDSAGDSNSFSDEGFPSGSDDIDADLQSLKDTVQFDSVTDELKARLKLNEAPLLLPPKDYDTIVRRHGDIGKAEKRKCLQIPIVGGGYRNRNASDESGIEIPSPTSSEGKQGSMDISDDKISSVNSSSNGASSPLVSPRYDYDIYPPKSPATPTAKVPTRSRPSSSRSSGNYSDKPGTVIYNGVNHLTEIPPADYDDEVPIMRNKAGMFSARDLTKSMPASALQRELDYGYSVLPSRLNRHSSAKYSEIGLSPRGNMGGNFTPRSDVGYGLSRTGVRRVNSMYR